MIDFDFVPETLDWCMVHYVPPVQKYISCADFGKYDCMNGSCIWCSEMTPYQWHMCSDQSWVNGLLNEHNRLGCKTQQEAVEFIESHKKNSVLHRFEL